MVTIPLSIGIPFGLVEEPTDLDLARLDAWTRAVRSDYLAARQLEDQLGGKAEIAT
jgi:hypothetical protein